jgi:hypothetical protein
VLALERLTAQFLHASVQRIRQEAVDVDVVELATDADLAVASRPGLATPHPAPQFLDNREERGCL